MKSLIFILLLSFFVYSGIAQIGVGTDSPHDRALLHLEAVNKGFLMPRLNTGQTDAMKLSPVPPAGMTIFNSDSNEVYVFDGTNWQSVTPFKKQHSVTTSPGNKGRIKAVGNALSIKSLDATTVNAVDGNGIVPLGAIFMWSGTTPPPGYEMCDGNGGVKVNGFTIPDLRSKFIVGYNSGNTFYDQPGNLSSKGTTVGDQAGAEFVSLNLSQIPRHNHTASDAGHSHGYSRPYITNERSEDSEEETEGRFVGASNGGYNTNPGYANISIGYTGGLANGQTAIHENRPPYYTLAFIMRVQ